ncbi:sugar phosphate isomerase/epimerase [Pseudonocardia nematodicida]|uniref:Sugar phosphate isomerase/epimerase n=1 Tax=Pseudonocardia nematodicida TaxID=1206997 RepID=A0ABV1KE60_9PSEU
MKTAFHTGFLGHLSAGDAVRLIRDHGYDEAELNGELLPWTAPHVSPQTTGAERAELAELGPYAALSAHHAAFGSPEPQARAAAAQHTAEMLRLAADLGIGHVHVIPGGEADRSGTFAALETALAEAERLGITLSLEVIVNQALAGAADVAEAVNRLPGLRVNFDASHLQVTDGDVLEAAQRFAPQTVGVAIKDAVGTPADFAFVPLGTGDIDFAALLSTLAAGGFDGSCSVEHESHWFAGDERGPDQVLSESKSFLDALLETLR